MTEAEWLACTDPAEMLTSLHGEASERKLRLFACACARQLWASMTHPSSREAVVVAERFADRLADRDALSAARKAIPADLRHRLRRQVVRQTLIETASPERSEARAAVWAGAWDAAREVLRLAAHEAARHAANAAAVATCAVWGTTTTRAAADARQAALLRDIAGNPFDARLAEASWLAWQGGIVPKLAQAVYQDRAFGRLPIVADALEEAGCCAEAILSHCRGPGPHVRGCWALDLLLGKS